MAKAFLSHSSRDKELVEKIASQLGKNNCHYDKFTFEAGRMTIDEIFKGLEDTDVFVLFISETALKSPWIQKEIIQAKHLYKDKNIDRIFPIIIDKTIDHTNTGIPEWIRKPFNLKVFDNEVLILKKIRQLLRESNFKKYSHLREVNDLFVGRNDIMQDFERKIINIDNNKPSCIIASSFFDGIGRRTFLKNALIKTRIIDKLYDPVIIPISSKESIEDFLYKLNFVESVPDVFKKDFTSMSLKDKIELGRKHVNKFVDNGEVIFIVDDGSIVLPNHTLVSWFKDIILDEKLYNKVCICLISKYKPYVPAIKKLGNVISFQIDELSKADTQTFFIQYLDILKHHLKPEDIKFFLQYLKGIPGQIVYASNIINNVGVLEAKKLVYDIEEFDELRALSILDYLKDDHLSRQILVALSRFEIVSYDLVYRIFGESEEVNKSIQTLFDLTLFFPVSSTHEYLKLNTSIADYINRSRIVLDKYYADKLKQIARETIQKPLELTENSDYSEFLFNLEIRIRDNLHVPSKFLIPSFILKSIVKEYNDRQYKTVIELTSKLLENEDKFDYEIIREARIWLCLAYSRKQNEKFFEVINFFNTNDYTDKIDFHFLMGFYYRKADRMAEAEDHFFKVLHIAENHSRSKRELVNVYLKKGEYSKAISWARDNYMRFKTNILHIQAYFTSLIKEAGKEDFDIDIVEELLENAQKSLDKKATAIYTQMQAEFDFYVEGNDVKATQSLKESLQLNPHDYFAYKALYEIYKRKSMIPQMEELATTYLNLVDLE